MRGHRLLAYAHDAPAQKVGDMFERTIIVPLRDNAGRSLAAQRAAIERELCSLGGGFTREKVSGAWLDNGTLYRDQSYRYSLAVNESQDAAIVARLPEWCAALRQLALYTARKSLEVAYVAPVEQEARAYVA